MTKLVRPISGNCHHFPHQNCNLCVANPLFGSFWGHIADFPHVLEGLKSQSPYFCVAITWAPLGKLEGISCIASSQSFSLRHPF